MKLALISTTINVPRVFALYRAFGPEVDIIVTGDRRTPHDKVRALLAPLGVRYLDCADQEKLGAECSEVIGWNCIQRRNLALLEAMRIGADIIATVDDDNIPLDARYFNDFTEILGQPFNGLMTAGNSGWFDVGAFIVPPAPHRGLPVGQRRSAVAPVLRPATNVLVGVAAGLWFGDPDTDAMTRIVSGPIVHQVSEVLRSGLVVSHECFTPFNSQNTAYCRELAPLMAMWIDIGRYDDIWASLFAQRVMSETGHHVHFGRPYVWQQRNEQDLLTNLQHEFFGDRHTERFAQDLLEADVGKGSVVAMMRKLFDQISGKDYIPERMRQFTTAWCNDVDRVIA